MSLSFDVALWSDPLGMFSDRCVPPTAARSWHGGDRYDKEASYSREAIIADRINRRRD